MIHLLSILPTSTVKGRTMSNEPVPAPQPTPGSTEVAGRSSFSLSLRARDLLNVAIFAVIYLVALFAINMLGFINPLMMLLALLASVIVCGIPFMLFLTRVKRPGMVALFGVVMGLFCLLTGLGLISAGLTVVLSLIAEAILWFSRYRSRWAAIAACTVFALWFIGPFIPLLIDREAYLSTSMFADSGAEFVAAFDHLVTVPVVWGYNAATLVCGWLGARLGSVLLEKHFVRAGLA